MYTQALDLPDGRSGALKAVAPPADADQAALQARFDVRIDAGELDAESTSKELGGEVGVGFGPVSFKLKGSLANKSEQTRKSDTSARYTVHLEASRQPMPEAFQRVVEALIAEVLPRHTASGMAAATSPAASIPNPAASIS